MPRTRSKYRHKHKYPKLDSNLSPYPISISPVKYTTAFLVLVCVITFFIVPGG